MDTDKQYRNCGTLDPVKDGGLNIVGRIATVDLDIPLLLEPVLDRETEKHPTHRVWSRTPKGNKCEIGVAWMGNARSTGKPFISFELEADGLPAWVYDGLAAFGTNDGGYRLCREVGQTGGEAAA